jgi:hypothetical protein
MDLYGSLWQICVAFWDVHDAMRMWITWRFTKSLKWWYHVINPCLKGLDQQPLSGVPPGSQ